MKSKQYYSELGATAACTMRLAELGRSREIGRIKGDFWFGSCKVADVLGKKGMMAVLVVSEYTSLFYCNAKLF